jgi:hypothetical protein
VAAFQNVSGEFCEIVWTFVTQSSLVTEEREQTLTPEENLFVSYRKKTKAQNLGERDLARILQPHTIRNSIQ